MRSRLREEVINTVLAACIANRGTPANPETIRLRGAARPDVIASFRGLRCTIEGKVSDVPNALNMVLGDALNRIEQGISQISVAVVYPADTRTTEFADLPAKLEHSQLDFCICTEVGPGDWHLGRIDDILNELRRSHEVIINDNVVKAAVEDLSLGLSHASDTFLSSPALCDRLIKVLGIGEKSDAANSD